MSKSIQEQKIGILGAGQLGKMLAIAAAPFDLDIYTMDSNPKSPAHNITKFTQGNITDYDAVMAFGQDKDIITIEIENVNIQALEDLEKAGKLVRPSAQALKKIVDKGIQREFYAALNIPQPLFSLYKNLGDIQKALDEGQIKVPFVQKSRTEGYDGKGVQIIRTTKDLDGLWDRPCVIESCVDIKQEVSIIVARRPSGETAYFPAVDMVFNDQNLVDYIICPSNISKETEETLKAYSLKIVDHLGIEGLLAIEYFIDNHGQIYVNEVAPRPHNSGHHTIDNLITSQFEQHMRAILDMPLGNTSMISPAVTANILGEPDHTGPVHYKNIESLLETTGLKVHLYNKTETKPHRKMGHITIIDESVDIALEKAIKAKQTLKIISK